MYLVNAKIKFGSAKEKRQAAQTLRQKGMRGLAVQERSRFHFLQFADGETADRAFEIMKARSR